MSTLELDIAENKIDLVADFFRSISFVKNVKVLERKRKHHRTVTPAFGCMKGTVTWMSDDFNAPLEDFKEYM